ncbi:DNA/RNA non-specific endonuclease [Gracilibacillus suaedae]|uniref:DNA/RNA non-specific endonuclease n=1 Tax=Gracilibacillus suaedae TaxID=2820273 RepID=UPI001ABEAC6C|nr:DNA/RNA non-specific endonuclease [Gracilibacillus suaedae]
MSSTETLETKSLVETVEARAQEYKGLSEQLETLRTAFQQIVDLNDFTGKSANAIKGFYRAQIDVIEAWLDFIDMQIAFFQGIEGMAEDFELGGKTLVEVPFLERELANSTSKAFNLVDAQQSNLQSIFSRINDLVSLDVFSKSDFEERMEDAEDKRKQTKQKVREFDQLLLEHYHQSSLHEQVIVGLIQEMLHASSQGGEISPVHFNEIIYQQSEVHQARQDAQELTSSYMQYQEELQENRELQAKIEEMENRPWYEKAWDTVCTFTGEITGYYDAKRASTGVDPVTGEKLTTAERVTAGSLAAAGFIPVVGWAGRALKGGKTAYTMSKGVKATDHVLDAYQNAKAFDILKKTEYGIYGLASYNGFSEYITGKDMFGNELSEEKRNQSLTQSLFMLGAGGASVAVDRIQAKNSLSTIFPTPKPPATVPKTPKPWSVNYAMKWLKEQIPEVRIVQDSMGGSYPVLMKRSGGGENVTGLRKYGNSSVNNSKQVNYGEQFTKIGGKKTLKPNIEYTTKEGYHYKTDSDGRISNVEAKLELGKADRNQYAQRTVGGKDRLSNDDGGHLIASIFKGSGDIDNLVPMNANLNRSEYKTLENTWKKALEEGKEVRVKLKPIYLGNSIRPSEFKINYTIDGRKYSDRLTNYLGG